jgi:hypothetical protein
MIALNSMEWMSFGNILSSQYFFDTLSLMFIEKEIFNLGVKSDSSCLDQTRRFEYPWVMHHIPGGCKRVLDAGGGDSVFQFWLARNFGSVVNVEIQQKYIDRVLLTLSSLKAEENLQDKPQGLSSGVPPPLSDYLSMRHNQYQTREDPTDYIKPSPSQFTPALKHEAPLRRFYEVKQKSKSYGNLEVKKCFIHELEYPDGYFDCCVCVSVLEHIRRKYGSPIENIEKLRRITDGPVLLTFDVFFNDAGSLHGEPSEVMGIHFERDLVPILEHYHIAPPENKLVMSWKVDDVVFGVVALCLDGGS